jgi:nicotinamidase-related amidase
MKAHESKEAFLLMDVQPGIVDRLEDKEAYLEGAEAAVRSARERGMPVIHVVVGFRPGFPEVSPNNKSFSAIASDPSRPLTDPHPAMEPAEGDIVVTKRRVSAFTGSDLEVVLRGLGATHLILSGIATSGVVLSTLREAADKDYRITVLSDLCADFDPEVHDVLLQKVFPRQADVRTSEEWMRDAA